MEKSVKITVVMAVYNTDFLLVKRAIDSVLAQTYKNFELIIVDDGSTNDGFNQILEYTKKREHIITYLRHKNCGQSQSINKGILNANGSYIAIIDADDEYEPHHLQSCLLQMADADLIASTTNTIVDSVEDYYVPDKNDNSKLIHVDDCILFATLFGKKEVFKSANFKTIYAADAHFYEHAAKNFKVKKVNLRSYIYYRNRKDSICAILKNNQFNLVA
jgi:glycosyltransferase involved in cell wall biosynthesis